MYNREYGSTVLDNSEPVYKMIWYVQDIIFLCTCTNKMHVHVFTQTGCCSYEYHYINLITKPTIGL